MAFYLGFAAYISYDNSQQQKHQTQMLNESKR